MRIEARTSLSKLSCRTQLSKLAASPRMRTANRAGAADRAATRSPDVTPSDSCYVVTDPVSMATEPPLAVYLDLLSQPCRAVHILLSCTRIPHRVRTVALRKGQHSQSLHALVRACGTVFRAAGSVISKAPILNLVSGSARPLTLRWG